MEKEIGWLLKEKYLGKPTEFFYKDIERLKAGEPLDYVIGFTEFLGCKINLSKKPLIPRTETEYWVEKVLTKVKKNKNKLNILDIFSGSGCIGISVLKNTKNTKCFFSDLDKNNLKQIKINCKINKIDSKRYRIIQSDIFNKINNKFNYIFANPPYIAKTKKNKIQKSVLKFEPAVALFGGNNGFLYINKFLKQAKNHLSENGQIFMEFDFTQKKEIEILVKKYKYSNCEFFRDQFNRWRWVEIS